MYCIRRGLILAALLFSPVVFAQQAKDLQSFKEEFRLRFDEESALRLFSPDFADQVAAGETEIRQQVQYDAPAKRLTVWSFTVPFGSPAITPMRALQVAPIEKYQVAVANIDVTARDIAFTGTVLKGAKAFLVPAAEGLPFSLMAAYYGTSFTRTIVRIADMPGQIAFDGSGALQFSDKPNQAPVAVVNADYDTTQPEVKLDASKSSDPDGEELDFRWRLVAGAAAIRGADTATPTVQLSGGAGVYQFAVTVTDARGASSEAIVKIGYYGSGF